MSRRFEMRCLGCLCLHETPINRNSHNIRELIFEATNISIDIGSVVDASHWICWQCQALLNKYIKFRRKIIRNHSMLHDYIHRQQLVPLKTIQTITSSHQPFTQSDITHFTLGKVEEHDCSETLKMEYDCDINMVKNEDKLTKTEKHNYVSLESPETNYHLDLGNDWRDIDDQICFPSRLTAEVKVEETSDLKCKIYKKSSKILSKSHKNKKSSNICGKIKSEHKSKHGFRRKRSSSDPSKIRKIILSKEEQISTHAQRATAEDYIRFLFKCELCFKGFNYQQKLVNHMMIHDKTRGEYECDICHLYMEKPDSFAIHERVHSIRYECTLCEYASAYRNRVLKHHATRHDGLVPEYTCKYCGKQFRWRADHLKHEREKHEQDMEASTRYQCDFCGKSYKDKVSITNHLLGHTESKHFGCDKCHKKFLTPTQAKTHRRTHSPEGNHHCKDCNVFFKSQYIYELHMLRSPKHAGPQAYRFQCDKCDKRFSKDTSLQGHMAAKHQAEKKFYCPICTLGYSYKSTMQQHIKTVHEGYKPERKFICELCGNAFALKRILQNHIRTHRVVRPFSCLQCGNTFSHKCSLKTHIRFVHLKAKGKIRGKKKGEIESNITSATPMDPNGFDELQPA